MKRSFFAWCTALLFSAGLCLAEEAAPAEAAPVEAAPVEAAPVEAAPVEAAPVLDIEAVLSRLPQEIVVSESGVLLGREEMVKTVRPMLKMAQEQGVSLDEAQLMSQLGRIARGIGMQKLFLQRARENGISGDMEAARKNLEQIREQLKEEFPKQLASLEMTEEELLERMLQEEIVGKYLEMVNKEVSEAVGEPAEEKVRAFYEENPLSFQKPAVYRASHILVQFPSQEPTQEQKEACLAKIKEIQGKLKEDASNFADLAKEYSDCPSKAVGGDLGEFPEGSMVPEFEAALGEMKEGQVSGPVETAFGYHLIKAGAFDEASMAPYEEAKEQIAQYLKMNAVGEAMDKKIEEMLEAAKFQVNIQAE